MAELYTKHSVIEIAPMDTEGVLDKYLTPEDRRYCARFGTPGRRMAWCTWRALARKHLGAASIVYDETGAPVVEGGGVHIGVSHSADYAAVIVSQGRCAIDIESKGRNFGRISPRFVSESENGLPESEDEMFLGAVWCAKETMYKYATHRKIDFLKDMQILETEFSKSRMRGALNEQNCGSVLTLDLTVSSMGNNVFTYIG